MAHIAAKIMTNGAYSGASLGLMRRSMHQPEGQWRTERRLTRPVHVQTHDQP